MRVTVDINVMLDVFQHREEHYGPSSEILRAISTRQITAVFPAHGLTTLYYLLRRQKARNEAEEAIDRILRECEIGNLTREDFQQARNYR